MKNISPKTEPSRRTQAERHQESTAKLLDAAATLFAAKGFHRTTFAQIGELAGFSSGLVAQRFGSKLALVDALIKDTRERAWSEVMKQAMTRRSPVERFTELLRLYCETLVLGGDRLKALFVLMAESIGPLEEKRDLFAEQNLGFVTMLRYQIEEGKRTGEVAKAIDAEKIALEAVAMLRGMTLMWLIDPEHIDLDRMCNELQAKCKRQILGGNKIQPKVRKR